MRKGGALVTGSARGIGRGIARALAQEGYDLAIHYRCSAA
ncbi:MAG: bifunctional dihydropteridine reductase/dihydrofolate reductase TmpR, partial [Thermoleophilia bacterium]